MVEIHVVNWSNSTHLTLHTLSYPTQCWTPWNQRLVLLQQSLTIELCCSILTWQANSWFMERTMEVRTLKSVLYKDHPIKTMRTSLYDFLHLPLTLANELCYQICSSFIWLMTCIPLMSLDGPNNSETVWVVNIPIMDMVAIGDIRAVSQQHARFWSFWYIYHSFSHLLWDIRWSCEISSSCVGKITIDCLWCLFLRIVF